jgi:FPC/CPF motif-containing protein YcgG
MYAPNDDSMTEVNEDQTQKRGRMMRSLIAKKIKFSSGSTGTGKSEINKYLSEDNEEWQQQFDILAWWKLNGSRFPILAHLARDLLAIPISMVASESIFSMVEQILDDFRTFLTPSIIQALICTQDWLRRSTPINIEEDVEKLSKTRRRQFCLFVYQYIFTCLHYQLQITYTFICFYVVFQN